MDVKVDVNQLNKEIENRIKQAVKEAETRTQSYAVRGSNELRNAALNVLRGQRSGRRYKKPGTKKTYYTASAPGEPPATRSGILRVSWGIKTEGHGNGNYTAGIYSDVPYAKGLDEGTKRTKTRPYSKRIIETAKPKVTSIFKRLETK